MDHPAILTLIAVFLWWFSTGAILLAVRWADRAGGAAHGMVTFAGVPLLSLGAAGVILSLQGDTVGAVFAGFLGALAVWGWVELAFLTGIVAGPERAPCPPGLTGAARFWRAWGAVSHHELALTLGLTAITAVSIGAENLVALWAYVILYGARVSAKLNLYLGVPRINTEFIPAQMRHLASYMRRGPVTFAFPLAITALSLATGYFVQGLIGAETPVDRAAFLLLATLAGLATLEHWLMVVPLPDAKLWRWMLPAPPTHTDTHEESPRP